MLSQIEHFKIMTYLDKRDRTCNGHAYNHKSTKNYILGGEHPKTGHYSKGAGNR